MKAWCGVRRLVCRTATVSSRCGSNEARDSHRDCTSHSRWAKLPRIPANGPVHNGCSRGSADAFHRRGTGHASHPRSITAGAWRIVWRRRPDLMENPELSAAELTQARCAWRKPSGLAEALGVSQSAVERLFEVMAGSVK